MIGCKSQLVASDGTSSRNRTVSVDVGQESGIGSDSDSIVGVDPTLTPSHPSSTDDPALSLDDHTSTSGSTELLSADKPQWRHLAERYASNLPHNVINEQLEEKFARLVLPPPPPSPADSKPEMKSTPEVDSVQVRLCGRRLPAVPTDEMRLYRELSEAAKDGDDEQQQEQVGKESAELWRQAALVRVSSETTAASTLPRSRDRRQPISDVASARPLVMTSQCHTVGDVTDRRDGVSLETFRPVKRTTQHADHVSNVGQKLDRKWTENGTDDVKWKREVNAMSYYLSDMSLQIGDVIKPDVTSDRKYLRHVTSSEPDRKQLVTCQPAEVDMAQKAADIEQRELEGGVLRSNKLLERRRAAGGGRLTQQPQMRIMVDQLNSRQRQIQNNNKSPSPGHVTSLSSQPSSPQHVPPVRHHDVTTRRQLDYEAELRRLGPNHHHHHHHHHEDHEAEQPRVMSSHGVSYTRQHSAPVDRPTVHCRQLPPTPHTTSSDALNAVELNVVEARRGVTQRQMSTPHTHSTSRSAYNAWQSVQTDWQTSLPRVLHQHAGLPAHQAAVHQHAGLPAHQAAVHHVSDVPEQRRSSSAAPSSYRESAVDVEFVSALHRPLPHKAGKSSSLSTRLSEAAQTSPKPGLRQKFGNLFRRSKSANSSREPSPVTDLYAPSPGKDRKHRRGSSSSSSKDSKEVKESKDGKVKSVKKKSASRKRYEEMTVAEMMRPATVTVSATENIAGQRRASSSSVKGDVVSTTSSEPLSDANSASSPPSSPGVSTSDDTDGHAGRLKLATTPVDTEAQVHAVDTGLSRPHQLRLQLNASEQAVVARRYDQHAPVNEAVNQALADVNLIMTSSTTPTHVTSSAGVRSVVDGSFRRVELVPTVRRFISSCQQLSAAATSAERAEQFNSVLTDSVHAFTVVLAVSRRSTYAATQRQQLSAALRQVGQCYCEMVQAAGAAVGLAADHQLVIGASKSAAKLALQLSSLLDTVKKLGTDRRIVFF